MNTNPDEDTGEYVIPEQLPAIDDEPDEWADEHPEATEVEVAEGNRLGDTIDWNDDNDNGGVEPER